MKFTLSWLKEHLDTDAPLEAIVDKLTMIGLEVENVEDKAKSLAPFVVASVISAEKHPNADRLRVCMVDAGQGAPVQVVCGAPNARAGMKGVFAPPGTHIPGTGVDLKVANVRGVESRGMLCSEDELQLSDDHEGIIELPADAPVGKSAAQALGLDDPVIEINLTPNRPDCTGVHGIARDLAAADMGKFIDTPVKPVKGTFPCPVSVRLDFGATPSLCKSFALRLVKGVKNGPSPAWLQKRLTAIGLRPINTLVDITNLITLRPRPAVARVRRSESTRQSGGAPRAAGRAACRARRQDLLVRRDDVRHCRRQWRGIARRNHRRRGDRLLGNDHRCADRIRFVGRAQHCADRAQARDQFGRALSVRARRGPCIHAAGTGARHPNGARALRRRAVGDRCCRQRRTCRNA